MRTLAIINQKGGCGKTTTAINLSAMLAKAGQRALLVDMDPQGHCAVGLGIPEQRIELDIGDAMLAGISVGGQVIGATPNGPRPVDSARLVWRAGRNLDLAPARMKLAGLEAARGGLADMTDRDRRLMNVLRGVAGEYDVAVIDCPPSIGLLTYNALAAADMVVIPVETSFFSLQGATRQLQTVQAVGRRLGVNLPVWILPTIHDTTNAVAADLLEELGRRFKGQVLPVAIRRDPRLREAASFGQTIQDYAPASEGAADYAALAHWVASNLRTRSAAVEMGADATIEQQTTLAVNDPMAVQVKPVVAAVAPQAVGVAAPVGGAGVGAGAGREETPEVKPVSRAEDVARRAQEFLRRIALGRNGGAGMAGIGANGSGGFGVGAGSGGEHGLSQAAVTTPDRQDVALSKSAGEQAGVALLTPRTVLKVVSDPTERKQPVAGAKPLLGVRQTNQGVLFVQPISAGNRISIAGSFNGWNAETHVMKRNAELGVHELLVKLAPGRYQYRMVFDGQWSADSYNNTSEPNPFGEPNSIVEVTRG